MDLKGIISITGMSGLYRVVAQSRNGFIVESLKDKKKSPISASQRISALEDISVYTVDEDVPLAEVFTKIKNLNGGEVSIDPKADNKTLETYFKTVLPNFDSERVYTSDIKKIINWYILIKDSVGFDSNSGQTEEEVAEAAKVAAKVKKSAAPKAEKPADTRVKAESKKGGAQRTRKKV